MWMLLSEFPVPARIPYFFSELQHFIEKAFPSVNPGIPKSSMAEAGMVTAWLTK